MIPTTRKHFTLLPWALLTTGTFAATYALLPGDTRAEDATRPHGRYTAAQVLERSAPVCHALLPEVGRPQMVAEKQFARSPRDGRRFWYVECRDESGADLAYLYWNADTGDLQTAGGPRLPGAARKPISHPEAVRAAEGWLRRLGIGGETDRWRPVQAYRSGSRNWWVVLQAGDRTAAVALDARTGRLRIARCCPTPPP